MAKIDFKTMSGKELWDFYSTVEGEGELFELVPLLPMAVGDMGKVYEVLEQIHQKGRKLVAHYPEIEKESPKNAEYLGEIIDGGLYLVDY